MSELDNLIGSKISLVSQQDIRYEGILISINAAESSIVLRDVDCLGTEDRVTDPSRVVKPTSTKIKFVSFPGADIKDLFVHEEQPAPEPVAAPAPAPATVFAAPASYAAAAGDKPRKAQSTAKPAAQQREPRSAPQEGQVGKGDHLRTRKTKGGTEEPEPVIKGGAEFNFDAGLQKFDKEEVFVKVKEEGGEKVDTSKYVKDDFFDSLSCDVLDRQAGRQVRVTGQQQRSLNLDTFGAVAVEGANQYNRSGRGRGRGGGRGGRGGGRGGGGGRGRGSTAN